MVNTADLNVLVTDPNLPLISCFFFLAGVQENICSLLVVGVQRKNQICRHSAGPLLEGLMTCIIMVSISRSC